MGTRTKQVSGPRGLARERSVSSPRLDCESNPGQWFVVGWAGSRLQQSGTARGERAHAILCASRFYEPQSLPSDRINSPVAHLVSSQSNTPKQLRSPRSLRRSVGHDRRNCPQPPGVRTVAWSADKRISSSTRLGGQAAEVRHEGYSSNSFAPSLGSPRIRHACCGRIPEHTDDRIRRRCLRDIRLPGKLSVPWCRHPVSVGYQSLHVVAVWTSQEHRLPTRVRNVDPNGGRRNDGHLFLDRGGKPSDVSNWKQRAILDFSRPGHLVCDRWWHQVQTGLPRRSCRCASWKTSEPPSPLLPAIEPFESAVGIEVA